jgi:hypothetical protein
MPDAGVTLEARLEQLQQQEAFSPSADFRASAVLKDASDHEFAERDPEGFWARAGRALHWERPWDTVLDWSNPSLRALVRRGPPERLVQLPRPSRRGRARRSRRLALARGGRQRARRQPMPSCCATSADSPTR